LAPQEKLAEDYRVAFSTESGNAVLQDLEHRFQLRGSFVPDSNVTAFHEGQRDVYRLILLMIAKDVARGNKPHMAITEETHPDGE
jgi:hypothetical protein